MRLKTLDIALSTCKSTNYPNGIIISREYQRNKCVAFCAHVIVDFYNDYIPKLQFVHKRLRYGKKPKMLTLKDVTSLLSLTCRQVHFSDRYSKLTYETEIFKHNESVN